VTDTISPPQFELVLNLSPDGGLTETARQNREATIKAYRDLLAGDDQALIKLLDPEVVFLEAKGLPYGVEAKGIQGAIDGVAGMFSAWKTLRAEFFEFTAAGDIVIAYMMLTGVGRATGMTYEGPTAELFRFRRGKIIEWSARFTGTRTAFARFAGLHSEFVRRCRPG
jgi:ketosteroid isomerase-like protein